MTPVNAVGVRNIEMAVSIIPSASLAVVRLAGLNSLHGPWKIWVTETVSFPRGLFRPELTPPTQRRHKPTEEHHCWVKQRCGPQRCVGDRRDRPEL